MGGELYMPTVQIKQKGGGGVAPKPELRHAIGVDGEWLEFLIKTQCNAQSREKLHMADQL